MDSERRKPVQLGAVGRGEDMTQQNRIQGQLLSDGVFDSDLTGYAASALAANLLTQWDTYDTPISAEVKRQDVLRAIEALKQWMVTL